jgi:hypothetical protein
MATDFGACRYPLSIGGPLQVVTFHRLRNTYALKAHRDPRIGFAEEPYRRFTPLPLESGLTEGSPANRIHLEGRRIPISDLVVSTQPQREAPKAMGRASKPQGVAGVLGWREQRWFLEGCLMWPRESRRRHDLCDRAADGAPEPDDPIWAEVRGEGLTACARRSYLAALQK